MANRPKSSAKTESGELANFENLLRRVVSVPHSKIKAQLEAEREVKRPKSVSSARASRAKD